MKKFVIERKLPGAGNMTAEELKAISQTSVNVVDSIGKPYKWVESFVTDDTIYCIHEAESEDIVMEHSALSRFPVNKVKEVKAIICPDTAN